MFAQVGSEVLELIVVGEKDANKRKIAGGGAHGSAGRQSFMNTVSHTQTVVMLKIEGQGESKKVSPPGSCAVAFPPHARSRSAPRLVMGVPPCPVILAASGFIWPSRCSRMRV